MLFRLVARFRKTQRTSSLKPRKRGTQEGVTRLDPRTERVIAEQAEGFWLKKEKPSFAALMRRIGEVCLTEGLSPPHRSTVQRRVSELIPIAAARKRGEREIEAASTTSPGQLSVAKPNALWQIDHTIVDVVVVDEQYRQPIDGQCDCRRCLYQNGRGFPFVIGSPIENVGWPLPSALSLRQNSMARRTGN